MDPQKSARSSPTSPLDEDKIRSPISVTEAPDFGKGAVVIESNMDGHLRSLEAEAAATAKAATEVQRRVRGHLARKSTVEKPSQNAASLAVPSQVEKSSEKAVEHIPSSGKVVNDARAAEQAVKEASASADEPPMVDNQVMDVEQAMDEQ